MASHLTNTTIANLRPGLQQAGVYMPRRRKQSHFNKMSLMLLIFAGCCLTLILRPLHVQAKDSSSSSSSSLSSNNATSSKGENMLSHDDPHSHQHEEGETNINADKTNDNGTFKRLYQTPSSDTKIANREPDHGMAEKEEDEEEEDEHSSEVIEMIQPPHTLRHQEHYKQRILLAEQQRLDGNSDGDTDVEEEKHERELSQYNRNLRYRQIQQALRETIAFPTPHHRRHEHRLAKHQRLDLLWPQQHHLRHQHHQQQQQQQETQELQHHHNQPQQLRHLKHEMRKQNITAAMAKPLLAHHRYFDRESSYMNPLAATTMVTTEGPHLRHSGANLHWKSLAYSSQPNNRLFGNDAQHNNQKKEEDIKRFSLSLDGLESANNKEDKESIDANVGNDDTNNYDVNEDYSYEDDANDDDDEDKQINRQKNNYPSASSSSTKAKTNVKRYTNPTNLLHNKPSASPSLAYTFRHHYAGHRVRYTPPHNMATGKMTANKINNSRDNDNEGDDDDDNKNDNDDDDEYEDGIENNEDKSETLAFPLKSSNNRDDVDNEDDSGGGGGGGDEDDKMSDEKWNKIEHEHYRKQLQHQRAMQALRSRRPQNDNRATHPANTSKYSAHSPSSSAYNNAWAKRQTISEGESDNIYSRYYVPGSVTRKKEEELGSPAAILESRRQYALQQRQNKALASAHHRRIVTEGTCRLPQPRVERIRRDSWKIYTPHCTILHRCADDAGCCPSERQTCAPKRTKNVDLYFFVISLNETQGSIEKLTFVNHTECHCVDRSKQRAPEYGSSGAKDLIGSNNNNNNQISYLRRATILNCYCPNLFEKILQEDGFCRCDCSSGNTGCDWLKRGMEHFSMNDRKCIIEGRCKLPTCEYGQYIKKYGRCPRREERHLSGDIDW